MVTSAPIGGDAMLVGGSVDVRKEVAGDVRAFGGVISIDDKIGGDLVALGSTVIAKSAPKFAWIGGADVSLLGGARGPVVIYGSTVTLSGTFESDVDVTASDSIVVEKGTVVHGYLHYNAPQQASIPADVVVDGGVTYTGKSYLPTTEEAQTFALAGAGIFFLVRILAAVIAAGLFAGIFPALTQAVADRALSYSVNRFLLLTLLGFGVLVATPVLILLLIATFAGAIIAFILLAAYVLLILLAYLYAAVIAGAALTRSITKRTLFLWRDAVFGMLALSVVGLIPVFGTIVLLVLVAAAAGTLVSLGYQLAFPKDTDVLEIE
jgi:hypothetical protein